MKLTLIDHVNSKIQQSTQRAHHSWYTIQFDPPRNFYPGFVGKTIKTFSKFSKELKLDVERIIKECQDEAIRTSHYIYIAEEERNELIQDLCRTHDYIVLAILVGSKRPNYI